MNPLEKTRQAALERFEELGFPTTKQEEWRFTDLAPLAKSDLELAAPTTNGVATSDVERLGFGPSLVFVDGHYRADLSAAPAGVSVATVSIDPSPSDDALVLLNTAHFADGAYVEVDGELEDALHVLFIGTDGKACHPRNVYRVKQNGKAEIVETYVSLGKGEHWTNSVTTAIVEQNAEMKHTRLQLENEAAFHTASFQVEQERDSRFTSNIATLGGRLVRNDLTAALNGENCLSTLNGLFLAHGNQHVDNHTKIEHRMPHCESHELYKGILDDKSSGVFSGYIHVFEDAQKTDAYQSSAHLLLTDTAKADAQPQLEIYADDVKCSHGSTTGQLDKDALFYLRARGIPKDQARSILVRAFANDVTERFELDGVRERLEALIKERLPGA
ncbi:MAG: Fe-S cluster assembly protein SufD [Planctomycetota bacterium]|jgi:Fe-S cluster assembly protein SufD